VPYLFPAMLLRLRPSGFIEPCLPSPADRPPSGPNWIHEIKHDRFRLMARRDPAGVRLLTRNGNDWAPHYPLIFEAVNRLKVRSCLIDGEAACCDNDGVPNVPEAAAAPRRPARVPIRVRSARAQRQGPAARAARGTQGRACPPPDQGNARPAAQ
jgi:ATP-dependent DNA ligase